MGLLDRIMTALFGPYCEDGCGMRVYQKERDLAEHREKYCQAAGQWS